MSKFIKIMLVIFTAFFMSCSQKEDYVFHKTDLECYEIGYDSQNRVYLTDKRTNEQIVFICEDPAYSEYSKEDILNCYKIDKIYPYSEVGDYLQHGMMESCKRESFCTEVVYSKRFKSKMTRYYIKYKDAYGHFHM